MLEGAGRVAAVAPLTAACSPGGNLAGAAALRDLLWVPMFFGLDTGSPIVIEAIDGDADPTSLRFRMEPVGELTVSDVQTDKPFVAAVEESLASTYTRNGETFKSRVVLGSEERMHVTQPTDLPPARLAFLSATAGDASQDAMKLGALRREKRVPAEDLWLLPRPAASC